MTRAILAAVLIVRDEAGRLPGCLRALAGVADEIHVHDTGSADGTPELAAGLGATVTRGPWRDDFAAARNAAQAMVEAEWILAVDADHRVEAGAEVLRGLLAAATADALTVEVDDAHYANPYRQREVRLYRPDRLHWTGRVHERLQRTDGTEPERAAAPASALRLRHEGHATRAELLRRAERNLALSRRALGELPPSDREAIARTALGLGRDCVAAEHWQDAVDAFEMLRETFPGTDEWVQATDALARVVLARGYDKACLVLVDQLRAAGADRVYCDWLSAQPLAQLGYPHEAAALLAGVTEVVDPAGRRRHPAALRELSSLIDRLRVLAPAR